MTKPTSLSDQPWNIALNEWHQQKAHRVLTRRTTRIKQRLAQTWVKEVLRVSHERPHESTFHLTIGRPVAVRYALKPNEWVVYVTQPHYQTNKLYVPGRILYEKENTYATRTERYAETETLALELALAIEFLLPEFSVYPTVETVQVANKDRFIHGLTLKKP